MPSTLLRESLFFLRAKHADGSFAYYFDCGNSSPGGRFDALFRLIFGNEVAPVPGNFVIRPVDSDVFSADAPLTELLEKFDGIKELGWIDSLRTGDTGIGYTFETLLGIKENNDQQADFKGIEIKCKGTKEGKHSSSSKLNLFQAGPNWLVDATAKELIRILGKPGDDGLFACYSQVTSTPSAAPSIAPRTARSRSAGESATRALTSQSASQANALSPWI